ncbi:MAG: Exodeoxyribonuclease VII large subunit [uncultured Chloroflexi bacterium]|uniref:Exodeoxyribonuclease 7 large subunit n=1 Tax=uncultured Chloroflexota bacterium TaxID=166587 RepID=A0A6J4K109_9CHLR|nr:MAG: Exodeoxyribonuclease VII large subunit [uncultured Chloroflexota bacterium]
MIDLLPHLRARATESLVDPPDAPDPGFSAALGFGLGPAVLSVGEATTHIKSLLDDDPTLGDCWVRGEVSDPRTYGSGHTYFTLKDGGSQLKCVLFRQRSRGLDPLENGRQYVVRGSVSVYEANGVYQLYVTDHRPVGVGELYQQFELLKARLEADGLFAPERKRPLPRWPRRIGVATSAQGAVIHDLRQVLGRRFPLVELVLAPCLVQGATAARSIVASLSALVAHGVDLVVVARGGGSLEDLWAYNEEMVARTIAGCPVPVVSGVGHETDFTIADFVADVRAPTPSAAAEMIVPDAGELTRALASLTTRAERAVQAQLWVSRSDLDEREARQRRALLARLERAEQRLAALDGRLAALSPLAVLGRGYSVVRDTATGAVLRSAAHAHPGQVLDIQLGEGALSATVNSVRPTPSKAEQHG